MGIHKNNKGKFYGDIKVKRGRKHHYLGMDLDFESKGAVEISMVPYVQEIIKSFPEEIGSLYASTPAADHLFQVREEKYAKLVPEKQAVQFHHTVVIVICKH